LNTDLEVADQIERYEVADRIERCGAKAFKRFAHGLPAEPLEPAAMLRRAAIATLCFAWALERAQADAALAEIQRFEEARALDRERRHSTAGQLYPLKLQRNVQRARSEINDALRAAESNLVGLQLALDHVATVLRFDADAGLRLCGVEPWRRSSNVDEGAVEVRLRLTIDHLMKIATRLEETD
jgi:hypothetical protein